MRGSGLAPAATASRSAQAPAQKTACVASVVSWAWRGAARRGDLDALDSAAGGDGRAGLDGRPGRRSAPPPRSRRCRCWGSEGRRSRARGARARGCRRRRSCAGPERRWRGAALELLQAAELGGVGGDDQLAAALVGDVALLAVLVQLARALHAQARLQRAGRVVDAGVDHPGVVAGLVLADLLLALEHAHRRVRLPSRQLARHRQADDPPSDDRKVAALGRRFASWLLVGHRPQAIWRRRWIHWRRWRRRAARPPG